jgi:CMP-N-acetylneuraminic acid synthetase
MTETLALIPARGGSKGIPRKNLARLGGKPLLAWSVQAALGSTAVTRTVVSTDDPEIAAVAREYGAGTPFLRPADLATDQTPGVAPAIHALEWLAEHEGYRCDVLVYLQPTSPLRTSADIDRALALLERSGAPAVVSVAPAAQHPALMKTLSADGRLTAWTTAFGEFPRRQDLPPVYVLNGAVYAVRSGHLLTHGTWYDGETRGYVMPGERSLDIDTEQDLRLAEWHLNTLTA